MKIEAREEYTVTLTGNQMDHLIRFIVASPPRVVAQADVLLDIAREFNKVRRIMDEKKINELVT